MMSKGRMYLAGETFSFYYLRKQVYLVIKGYLEIYKAARSGYNGLNKEAEKNGLFVT